MSRSVLSARPPSSKSAALRSAFTSASESTYGASASIVVVLIWVYNSAQIVLFGAEFTHVRAAQRRAG